MPSPHSGLLQPYQPERGHFGHLSREPSFSPSCKSHQLTILTHCHQFHWAHWLSNNLPPCGAKKCYRTAILSIGFIQKKINNVFDTFVIFDPSISTNSLMNLIYLISLKSWMHNLIILNHVFSQCEALGPSSAGPAADGASPSWAQVSRFGPWDHGSSFSAHPENLQVTSNYSLSSISLGSLAFEQPSPLWSKNCCRTAILSIGFIQKINNVFDAFVIFDPSISTNSLVNMICLISLKSWMHNLIILNHVFSQCEALGPSSAGSAADGASPSWAQVSRFDHFGPWDHGSSFSAHPENLQVTSTYSLSSSSLGSMAFEQPSPLRNQKMLQNGNFKYWIYTKKSTMFLMLLWFLIHQNPQTR